MTEPVTATVGVHFYETGASVDLWTSDVPPDRATTELILFCVFALRQLSNLARSDSGRWLDESLLRAETDIEGFLHMQPRITPFDGTPGKRSFYAKLTLCDERPDFQMRASGFGFFRRSIDLHAAQSVVHLLQLLAASDDALTKSLLCAIGAECARAHLGGQITLWNQLPLAMQIVGRAIARAAPSVQPPMARPVKKEPVSQQRTAKIEVTPDFCRDLGYSLAIRAINQYRADAILELQCLEQYGQLSREHKAKWLGIRLAMNTRCCVSQRPELTREHKDAFMNGLFSALVPSDIGLSVSDLANLESFQYRFCSIPRDLIGNRSILEDLLFGFFACIVNAFPDESALRHTMERSDLLSVTHAFKLNNLSVPMPLDPVKLAEYAKVFTEEAAWVLQAVIDPNGLTRDLGTLEPIPKPV